jgi:hypothetical protein
MLHGKSNRRHLIFATALACFALLEVYVPASDSSAKATQLAREILDDSRPENERKAIIVTHPELSLDLLKALVADMPNDNTKEEYRRIPWIWRVTVAAAKRNEMREMKPIVQFTLPQPGASLRDWQAVVMGGGIINGIGLVGAWPDEQIESIVADDSTLRSRWLRTLELAGEMADDPKVFNGTRYDALRIIGLDQWDRRGAQLSRYLKKGKGIDDELVQGAIGGLGTMRSPHVASAILSEYPRYNEENRGFALEALLKDTRRVSALLDAIEAGTVKSSDLNPARVAKLTNSSDVSVSARARKLFAKTSN